MELELSVDENSERGLSKLPEEHQVNVTNQEAGHVLKLTGRLDIRRAEDLRAMLQNFVKEESNSVVDLSAVEACDATGLQLLLSLSKTLAKADRPLDFLGSEGPVLTTSAELGLSLTGKNLTGGTDVVA